MNALTRPVADWEVKVVVPVLRRPRFDLALLGVVLTVLTSGTLWVLLALSWLTGGRL